MFPLVNNDDFKCWKLLLQNPLYYPLQHGVSSVGWNDDTGKFTFLFALHGRRSGTASSDSAAIASGATVHRNVARLPMIHAGSCVHTGGVAVRSTPRPATSASRTGRTFGSL